MLEETEGAAGQPGFPGDRTLAIGPIRQLTAEEVDGLVKYKRDQSAQGLRHQRRLKETIKASLTSAQVLAEFGIKSQQHVDAWVRVAKDLKTKAGEEDGPMSSTQIRCVESQGV